MDEDRQCRSDEATYRLCSPLGKGRGQVPTEIKHENKSHSEIVRRGWSPSPTCRDAAVNSHWGRSLDCHLQQMIWSYNRSND